MANPIPLDPRQFVLTLWAASFAVQQFVEVVGDPICTYWIQHKCPCFLRRRSELDARTIMNGFVSASAGILIAVTCLPQGVFSLWRNQPYGVLDMIVTGFMIGAGTNGVNSLLKILQGTALSGLFPNAPPSAVGSQPVVQGLSPGAGHTDDLSSAQGALLRSATGDAVPLHSAIASTAFPVDATDSGPLAIKVPYVYQSCSEWCWAAVTSMISSLPWVPESFRGLDQCNVAALVFGNNTSKTEAQVIAEIKPCCSGQATLKDPCNKAYPIDAALGYLRLTGQYKTTAENAAFAQLNPTDVCNVINGTGDDPTPRPVAFIVQFSSSAHVVLAVGMSASGDSYTITVWDPNAGIVRRAYDEFISCYPQTVDLNAGSGIVQWAYFPREPTP